MNLLDRYLERTEFSDYEDFSKNLRYKTVTSFNFGYDVVDEYARLAPEKRALVWCDSHGNERIFTFAEMKRYTDKTANFLLSMGIKKGDFVMTMLNRRFEFYLINVACCKIGAILVPATYLLTTKDIVYRCNTAKVKMLICINEDEVINYVNEAKNNTPSVEYHCTVGVREGFINISEEIEHAPEKLCVVDKPSLYDIMLVYFTSGTIGQPKMVAHTFKYPLGHIMTAFFWQNVIDDGLHFTMAETGWAKFAWGKIYGQWLSGTAVFCYDYYGKFTPTNILPLLSKYKVTTFCAPPTIYRFLIKEDLSQYDFSSIKSCTTAGEPLNGEVYKQFLKATGMPIREGFGQSESAVLLATFKYLQPNPGSMGRICPIYDIKLLRDGNIEVGDDEEGEVCVKLREDQYGLLKCYYNEPERTEFIFNGGYYHTGDLAKKDADGCFWFVGRKDDIIKSSGYRIGPFEVESALHEHPAVLECAITGVPDSVRGQVVKATIVLAKGYSPSEELVKELQNHVKHTTAPYKYPRVVEFVSELPKTISGKIRHNAIRNKDKKD